MTYVRIRTGFMQSMNLLDKSQSPAFPYSTASRQTKWKKCGFSAEQLCNYQPKRGPVPQSIPVHRVDVIRFSSVRSAVPQSLPVHRVDVVRFSSVRGAVPQSLPVHRVDVVRFSSVRGAVPQSLPVYRVDVVRFSSVSLFNLHGEAFSCCNYYSRHPV